MSINPIGYRLTCDDHTGCPSYLDAMELFGPDGIHGMARAHGWTLNRRVDGQNARRGGKDYCRTHARGEVQR